MTFILTILFTLNLYGTIITPSYSMKSSGSVTDFIVEGDLLYAATDQGLIDVFDYKKRKRINRYNIPNITDFTGDIIPAKIHSIDKLIGKNELLIVSQGENGFRDVSIIDAEKVSKLVDAKKDKMMIKKASFINKNTIILGLLSNEIILFKDKKIVYKEQINTSTFSDFELNHSRSKIISTDESGNIHIIDVKSGRTDMEIDGLNLDNVYKLNYFNNRIITGGQDRRVAVYKISNKEKYYLQSDFLVYCVALNNKGTLGAYLANEENDIIVFNTMTKQKVLTLKGQKTLPTNIVFVTDNTIISSGGDPEILVWELP